MTSTDDVAGLCDSLRSHVNDRGGCFKDDDGSIVIPNGAWSMMLQAADLLESQANALREMEATLARVARVDNSLAKQLSESIATNAGLASERDTLRARLKEAENGLTAAIRAARLAVFTINKQGVMPNSSWESGFNKDLATADAARAFIIEGGK